MMTRVYPMALTWAASLSIDLLIVAVAGTLFAVSALVLVKAWRLLKHL